MVRRAGPTASRGVGEIYVSRFGSAWVFAWMLVASASTSAAATSLVGQLDPGNAQDVVL